MKEKPRASGNEKAPEYKRNLTLRSFLHPSAEIEHLRGWWPGRWILILGRYFTGISIVENLGVLIKVTDLSKSSKTGYKIVFRKTIFD